MTDNDIIEAYKNCQTKSGLGCHNCPFDKGEDCSCLDDLREATFNLINHQKAEIERLSIESETLVTQLKVAYEQIHKLNMAKSKAIKEFAERLKENYCFTDRWGKIIPISTVDNLVKEMTKGE